MSKKKSKGRYAAKKDRKARRLWTAIGILSVILCLLIGLVVYLQRSGVSEIPGVTQTPAVSTDATQSNAESSTTAPDATEPDVTQEPQNTNLGHDVELLDIGKYTGMFMEDGSDEIVSGVLMLKIVNNGDEAIQYAEITMSYGGQTAHFTVSTLLPGATMVLLEQNRMAYSADAVCSDLEMKNVAVFQAPLSLCEDKLDIQILDGAINVTNISGENITGEVRIYYKNYADGIYYGGITYVVRIQDGIPADAVKQIMASHFSDSGSVIMFVSCG